MFCPLVNKWLVAKPEEKVRQRYICTLVNDYGYSLDQMAQELKVNNSQRGQGKARADIVIWKSKKDKDDKKAAFIVVECKAENVKIRVEDYYQGFNYAAWAHADFFVTTNEKETKFFNVDPAFLPQKLEEVVAIATAKDVDNAKKIEQIKNQTKTFTREEFTKTLQACHNIIRNNDKLSPEAAFDEISKLLFMKIRYERQQRGTKVFTKAEYLSQADNYEKNVRPGLKARGIDQPYMQNLFDTTKIEFKEDHLFEDNDEIKIRENSFVQILEKLENYNLSDTQDDVKGIAFEQFLGTTFRGELGQFFTPRTIVDFMTEILDPQEGEVICDPTCGSGGFLIKAFEYVREKIEADVRSQKEKLRASLEGDDFDSKPEKEQIEISDKIDEMQTALNMLLDGRFYIIESATFTGDACSETDYYSYAQECQSRRLSYCKTDPAYCHSDHVFLMYDTVISPELLSKWIQLQDELDIVHQVALYNIADTGITHDVKCANLIECLEPMAEIIGLYDSFFPSLKPGEKTTTLKMCIDAVISKYGQDIFAEEYNANKGKFLQTLVNTRNRIMHIKRNQPTEKHLSGAESILYLVKLCHLYRVVLLSLLGIDYARYQTAVVKSVGRWNSWNGVLTNFINTIK